MRAERTPLIGRARTVAFLALLLVAAACGSSNGSPNPSNGHTTAICSLVTADEMSSLLSATAAMNAGQSDDTKCNFTLTNGTAAAGIAEIRYDVNPLTLDESIYPGGDAETVDGKSGYWSNDVGCLWVDLGTQRLVVQLVLDSTNATEALAQQVMEKALSRM